MTQREIKKILIRSKKRSFKIGEIFCKGTGATPIIAVEISELEKILDKLVKRKEKKNVRINVA